MDYIYLNTIQNVFYTCIIRFTPNERVFCLKFRKRAQDNIFCKAKLPKGAKLPKVKFVRRNIRLL